MKAYRQETQIWLAAGVTDLLYRLERNGASQVGAESIFRTRILIPRSPRRSDQEHSDVMGYLVPGIGIEPIRLFRGPGF
jgi:hypothetical protein